MTKFTAHDYRLHSCWVFTNHFVKFCRFFVSALFVQQVAMLYLYCQYIYTSFWRRTKNLFQGCLAHGAMSPISENTALSKQSGRATSPKLNSQSMSQLAERYYVHATIWYSCDPQQYSATVEIFPKQCYYINFWWLFYRLQSRLLTKRNLTHQVFKR